MTPLTPFMVLIEDSFDKGFAGFYSYYYHRLLIISFYHLKNEKDAEDVVQNLMTDLWKKKESIAIHSDLDAFIVKSLLFKVSDFRKKSRSVVLIKKESTEEQFIRNLEAEELRGIINRIIDEMPKRRQECFRMSRDQSLSYKEIAARLKISSKTVDHHISSALKTLRNRLKEFYSLFLI